MKFEYLLNGLTCANCAAKIENDIKKLDNVSSASVSAISSSLVLSLRENIDIKTEIEGIVHKYEPDVTVIEKDKKQNQKAYDRGHSNSRDNDSSKREIIQLATGALIFAVSFILEIIDINARLTAALFVTGYLILGSGVLSRAFKNITKGQILLSAPRIFLYIKF
jgi:Cd2+/Zn2+-exporting ATPase